MLSFPWYPIPAFSHLFDTINAGLLGVGVEGRL